MQISRPVGSYFSASRRERTTSSGARAGTARSTFRADRAGLLLLDAILLSLWRRPGANQLPNGDDLPNVIRSVIDSHDNGAEISLAGSLRNLRGEVDVGAGRE